MNNSRWTIASIGASPVGTNSWGQDRLVNEVVVPGESTQVRLSSPGVCQWEVRVVYANRHAEERRNVNICTVTELALDGSGTRPAP